VVCFSCPACPFQSKGGVVLCPVHGEQTLNGSVMIKRFYGDVA
jgi:hypothetical protein